MINDWIPLKISPTVVLVIVFLAEALFPQVKVCSAVSAANDVSNNTTYNNSKPQEETETKSGKSDSIKLNVSGFYAPKFVRPEKMTMGTFSVLFTGSILKLNCVAEGEPLPNITWFKNGVTPVQRQSGGIEYQKWSIVLKNSVTADSGNYTCEVSNKHGCIHFTYHVEIVNPSMKDGQPYNVTTPVNTNALFECTPMSRLRGNSSIRWLYHNASVGNVNRENLESGIALQYGTNKDGNESLQLTNVKHSDEGFYTCIIKNRIGENFASGYLKVLPELENSFKTKLFRFLDAFPFPVLCVILFSLLTFVCCLMLMISYTKNSNLKHRVVLESAKVTTLIHINNQITKEEFFLAEKDKNSLTGAK